MSYELYARSIAPAQFTEEEEDEAEEEREDDKEGKEHETGEDEDDDNNTHKEEDDKGDRDKDKGDQISPLRAYVSTLSHFKLFQSLCSNKILIL